MILLSTRVTAVMVGLWAAQSGAAQERASATVHLCKAQIVCNQHQKCITEEYTAQVIEIRTLDVGTGKASTKHLFSGPLLGRAGAGSGMFHRSEWTIVHTGDVGSSAVDLLSDPDLPDADHVWVLPGGTWVSGASALYHVRPGREVAGLRGDRVVTEFTCRQALF